MLITKKIVTPAKAWLLGPALGFILVNCNNKMHVANAPIAQASIFRSKVELIQVNEYGTKLISVYDSFMIIKREDITLYAIPFSKEFSTFTFDVKKDTTEQKFDRIDTGYNYYFFKKGKPYGLKYDSLMQEKGTMFSVDSLLKEKSINVSGIVNNKNDTLINTYPISEDIILEKYIPKVKHDDTYCDTLLLYFRKNSRNQHFSLSKEIDSLKNMKLFKIQILYNPVSTIKYPYNIPKREIRFEFQDKVLTNPNDIEILFERFKRSE